jgi:hypothetical protein
MIEALDHQTTPQFAEEQPAQPESVNTMEFARQQLLLKLVDAGLITKEFYASGVAEEFAVDEALHRDALTHMLVGDETGGVHHLPTLIALGVDNVIVASVINDPLNPKKPLRRFRREQRIRENGVFVAKDVQIKGADGSIYKKDGGSAMFPSEWSTQQVLETVLATSQTLGQVDEDRATTFHAAEINGVKVIAITDNKTGKIITGFPRREQQ